MSNMTADLPREKLKELVQKNGDGLLKDPDRCEGLLRDYCGSHRREISALVGALEERIPLEMKSSWQTAMTPEAMRSRLVQRLEENRGLAPEVANWAVDAWSYALGVNLGRRSDRVQDAGSESRNALGTAAGGPRAESAGPRISQHIASDGAMERSDAGLPNGGAKRGSFAWWSIPAPVWLGCGGLLLLGVAVFAIIGHSPVRPPAPAPVVNALSKPIAAAVPAGQGTGPSLAPGGTGAAESVATSLPSKSLVAGTVVSVRVDQPIDSDSLHVGDLLDATVSSPVTLNGNLIVPAGAKGKLKVISLEHAATEGSAEHLQLALVGIDTGEGSVAVATNSRQFDGPTVPGAREGKRSGLRAGFRAVGGFVGGKIFHRGKTGLAKAQPVKVAAETPIQFRLLTTMKPPSQTAAR